MEGDERLAQLHYQEADLQTQIARIQSALEGGHEPDTFRALHGDVDATQETLHQLRARLTKLEHRLKGG